MPIRKHFAENSVLHIFNKSIAGYTIFNIEKDYQRFIWMLQYFCCNMKTFSFSNFLRDHPEKEEATLKNLSHQHPSRISLIAYCIMPTHFHLALQVKNPADVSKFMFQLQNSYTQHFNFSHNRKGPLWESRFKHVECESDEQLLHLVRYIHLNPVTAYLVNSPEEWKASSYHEYIYKPEHRLCEYQHLINMTPEQQKEFTESRIEDQRILANINKLLLD